MEIVIRGDKIKVTQAINDYLKDKLSKLENYIEDYDNIRATVVVKVKNHEQKVEVTIPLKKFILRAEESKEDLYAAIDLVSDKLERQIRKNKTKLKKQNKVNNKYEYLNFDYEVKDNEEENNKIVKRKKFDTKPMDEEEAILEMELLGHNFFVYKDMHSDNVNVLYKRDDGNYGIIETK